jgi:hypothetical protein
VTQVVDLDVTAIERIEFYKRDRLTIDLICCDITLPGVTHSYHEEMAQWESLIESIQSLDGFRANWFTDVSQPPFAECRLTAYEKTRP